MTDTYYGTKKITAWRQVNAADESVEGYAVKYEDGYTSWSPKDVFENTYRKSGEMNFGHAIMALQEGKKIARSGWNGHGMFLILVFGSVLSTFRPESAYANHFSERVTIDPHIDMRTAKGTMQPGWLASQADMLADDWQVVDE